MKEKRRQNSERKKKKFRVKGEKRRVKGESGKGSERWLINDGERSDWKCEKGRGVEVIGDEM